MERTLASFEPLCADIGGDFKGRVGPTQFGAGCGDFIFTERFAVGLGGVLFVAAEANVGVADDEGGFVGGLSFAQDGGDGVVVVAINLQDVEAIGLKAFVDVGALGK